MQEPTKEQERESEMCARSWICVRIHLFQTAADPLSAHSRAHTKHFRASARAHVSEKEKSQ